MEVAVLDPSCTDVLCFTSKEAEEVPGLHMEVGEPRPNETFNPSGAGPKVAVGGAPGSEADVGGEQEIQRDEKCRMLKKREQTHDQRVTVQEPSPEWKSNPDGSEASLGLVNREIEVFNVMGNDCYGSGQEIFNPESKSSEMEGPEQLRWTSAPIGIFTVQCARCLKWRVVPTRQIYESIREHILETPWLCENALQWRAGAHCDLPTDLTQDSQSLWAMDKPNLPACPPGWERRIVLRRYSSSRFADVYYIAPDGKVLRSKPDVAKYIAELPGQLTPGLSLKQFSFTAPSPLPKVWNKPPRKKNVTRPASNFETSEDQSKKTRNS